MVSFLKRAGAMTITHRGLHRTSAITDGGLQAHRTAIRISSKQNRNMEKQEMDKAMQNCEVFLDHYLCQELDSDLPMVHQECVNFGHNLNVSKSNH